MKYVQLILDNSAVRFKKATSVYKIRNLLIVEYINEANKEVAFSIEFSQIQKLFVGSKRVLKDKVPERENSEMFEED